MTEWKLFGQIVLDEKGKPQFPKKLPEGIVVYKIALHNSDLVYIGCTEKLEQHLGQYRSGKTGVELERVIHEFIIDAGGGDLFLRTGKKIQTRSEANAIKKVLISKVKNEGISIINIAEGKKRLGARDNNSLFSARRRAAAARQVRANIKQEATIRVFYELQKEKGRRPRQGEIIRALEKEGISISESACTRYLKGVLAKR